MIGGDQEVLERVLDGRDKRLFLTYLVRMSEIYKSDSEDSAITQLDQYFKQKLLSLPALGVIFTSSITLARKISVKTYLPLKSHQLIICSQAGIVGQPSIRSRPIELEKYHFKLDAISGSFAARNWGDYKVIITDWKDEESPEPDPNDANYPVKCSIILSINFEGGDRFNSWLNSNERPIPIGGALVDKIFYKGKEVDMLTLSFVGKNVKAASFVLDTRTSREAEAKLTELKSNLDFDVDDISADVKTIGFLFICAGRGAEFYSGNLNVESNIVHKIFPHVLFSGVFGNGEYGWNCFNQPDSKKLKFSDHDLALSYTTAIVLVQFNRRR